MTAAALARTLILMRHAHAQSHSPDGDHERDLSGAGEHEAASAGAWLHGHDIGIDEVLCSSAERARQTAAGVWAGGCRSRRADRPAALQRCSGSDPRGDPRGRRGRRRPPRHRTRPRNPRPGQPSRRRRRIGQGPRSALRRVPDCRNGDSALLRCLERLGSGGGPPPHDARVGSHP
ncbi:MAG: histidine phosphatase family protein [Tetrasphaera sp.]|nr:histidine phosphatase family protein [Tetrasphaera sp.]